MPRLPQVSGHALIQLLRSLGYEILRQRGSHVRLRKLTVIGEHNITGIPKDELAERLR